MLFSKPHLSRHPHTRISMLTDSSGSHGMQRAAATCAHGARSLANQPQLVSGLPQHKRNQLSAYTKTLQLQPVIKNKSRTKITPSGRKQITEPKPCKKSLRQSFKHSLELALPTQNINKELPSCPSHHSATAQHLSTMHTGHNHTQSSLS
jgi:hypothetical protein